MPGNMVHVYRLDIMKTESMKIKEISVCKRWAYLEYS